MTNAARTSDAAEALAQQDRIAEAFQLLSSAASAGDGQSALTLADWRMAGALIRRDLGEARRLYGLAAQLGIADAAPVHIAMLANGAGGSGRHWERALAMLAARGTDDPAAARGSALIAAMKIDAEGEPLGSPLREVVHQAPRIERLPGFLSPDECRYIAELALPRLSPAVVIDSRSGQFIQDPVRNAETIGFPFVHEDPVLHAINRRIAAATATSYEQGEPLQVLSYRPGQEYKLHSDALPPGNNQRVATFLVTLSDGFTGGATSFPRLGLELTGKVGDGLFFVNTDAVGQPDTAMWHAGLPVISGRKLLLSKWIRERPLDLAGPPGRPF